MELLWKGVHDKSKRKRGGMTINYPLDLIK